MTTTLGIRDLARNTNILQEYDYIDIEDKKSHGYKGLFISPKYADEFRKLLEEKIMSEKRDKLSGIMQFAGMLSGEFEEMPMAQMKASKRKKYEDA